MSWFHHCFENGIDSSERTLQIFNIPSDTGNLYCYSWNLNHPANLFTMRYLYTRTVPPDPVKKIDFQSKISILRAYIIYARGKKNKKKQDLWNTFHNRRAFWWKVSLNFVIVEWPKPRLGATISHNWKVHMKKRDILLQKSLTYNTSCTAWNNEKLKKTIQLFSFFYSLANNRKMFLVSKLQVWKRYINAQVQGINENTNRNYHL